MRTKAAKAEITMNPRSVIPGAVADNRFLPGIVAQPDHDLRKIDIGRRRRGRREGEIIVVRGFCLLMPGNRRGRA